MTDITKVVICLDDEPTPLGVFECPFNFILDTTKLQDGAHTLKLISHNQLGREGVKFMNFTVRNGPEISIEGLKENTIVDGEIPIMVNAYGRTDQRKFILEGSETPRSVPSWVWALLLIFFCWATYFTIISFL